MTKKHFIALADALREGMPPDFRIAAVAQWQRDVDAIADVCAQSNPSFNRERWMGYVYDEHGPRGVAPPDVGGDDRPDITVVPKRKAKLAAEADGQKQ